MKKSVALILQWAEEGINYVGVNDPGDPMYWDEVAEYREQKLHAIRGVAKVLKEHLESREE